MPLTYVIRSAADAEVARVDQFRPESSDHRPVTAVRLWREPDALGGQFDVDDRYVRVVHTGFQPTVWKDSCVEIFLMPDARGYFNFEFSAGGHVRASFIRDPTRAPGGFADFELLTEPEIRRVEVRSSLPPRIEPEIAAPIRWSLAFRIPFEILASRSGPLTFTEWRGNFYKCGDETSHPHWASWSPVDALNFHLPHCFGRLVFEV